MNTKKAFGFGCLLLLSSAAAAICLAGSAFAAAAPVLPIPNINIAIGDPAGPSDLTASLQILFALTVLTLAPSILIMVTSFTRIVVVLSFVRNALGTQQMPPNQVLVSLAIFLTFFIMSPYFSEINSKALQPYIAGTLSQEDAYNAALQPIRSFMFKQTRENDLALFVDVAGDSRPETQADVSTFALIPAFMISELKTAFQIGFLVYVPFIVIDMVVASTLMSMGMMMLPPAMISLPFKVL
ncbi:MAG: flagellar type III secretion system pore protein FliP, partial [Acidaminococcales bacterium]|nr:flagellar type III secretion system pore protein FliP [Acidaminococcales bacterium]